MTDVRTPRTETRTRIVEAAAELLRSDGASALTTRGVAEAAGVQAPAIYRIFGDKDGLLEAVAEHVLATYVATKSAVAEATGHDTDPVDDLRTGWHRQVDFGLANPTLFRLLNDPARYGASPAARAGLELLAAKVHRIAVAGRLAVPEPQAIAMVQAAGAGTVQVLLTTSAEQRDPALADAMLDAVLARVLHDADVRPAVARPADTAVAAAVTLAAHAPRLEVLSEPERRLLGEWLDRVTSGG